MHLQPFDFSAIGFAYQPGRAAYSVDLDSPYLDRIKAAGFASFGRVTTLQPITEALRSAASISPDATLVAWAFPLAGSSGSDLVPDCPEEEAVVNGCFVYFSEEAALVDVRAVSVGPGMHFSGPTPLHTLNDGAKLRRHLMEKGLCHPVSVDFLKERGVREFWWVGPSEHLADETGELWENGAFVYLYEEASRTAPLDCVFVCDAAPDLKF